MHLCNFWVTGQQMMTSKLVTSVKQLFKENISKLTSHLEDPFRREAGSGTTPGQIELIHSPDRANYSQDRNSI